ncbi:MAG: STAS domain-containing protein [Chloroflexi bacterium]|nr:STAS domain-containing protein [Chloroflexota bacterium]
MNGQEWLDRSRIQLFEVFGRVNERSVQPLAAAINRALAEDRPQVILDLSGVEYMNSAGLRALVQLYKVAESKRGALHVTNPSPRIRELFALVGLDTIFGVGPNAYPDFSALFADTHLALQREVYHLT